MIFFIIIRKYFIITFLRIYKSINAIFILQILFYLNIILFKLNKTNGIILYITKKLIINNILAISTQIQGYTLLTRTYNSKKANRNKFRPASHYTNNIHNLSMPYDFYNLHNQTPAKVSIDHLLSIMPTMDGECH